MTATLHRTPGLTILPTRTERMGRAARALGHALVRLARLLISPLMRALGPRGLGRRVELVATEPAPSSPSPAASLPPATIRRMMLVHEGRGFAAPEVEILEVPPDFGDRLYPALRSLLELGPRSKLLDLRAAGSIKVDLFEHLAHSWRAAPGTVPRLAIVLDYERWTVFRNVAARRLRPLVDRGVAVALFYAQQIEHLPAWFADGEVRHEVRDVISWLRTDWRHSAIWTSVLAATAALVQRSAERATVPELLLEIGAIARSFDGPEGAEQAARYAREALSWVGSAPSRPRCRALRALAAALMRQGEIEAALSQLAAAITAAAVIQDRIEEATALAEIGFHALRSGRFARAETGFRRALALLTTEDLPYLRATLHHHLALALCEQGKDLEEAARHVGAALELRWEKSSRLAEQDRALVERIRAAQHRAACSADAHDHTTEDT